MMKLAYVDMAGFRGFRSRLRIDLSPGLTVISGRNGVGKSTICDAVEYALTGDIQKYRVEKANLETFADYIWWRGNEVATEFFVRVGFFDDDGSTYEIERSREGGLKTDVGELEERLCDMSLAPKNPLEQLSRTAIIRDESIAAQSLDLKETERFDIVSSALGELETSDYGAKAKEVRAVAEQEYRRVKDQYDVIRTKLAEMHQKRAEVKSRVLSEEVISTAISGLGKILDVRQKEIPDLLEASRQFLKELRSKVSILDKAVTRWVEAQPDAAIVKSAEFQAKKTSLSAKSQYLKSELEGQARKLEDARQGLEAAEVADQLATAIVKMVEGGETVGLRDGHCPLCAAERTTSDFNDGLDLARERAGELGKNVADASRRYEKIESAVANTNDQVAATEKELQSDIVRESDLKRREEQILRLLADARIATVEPLSLEHLRDLSRGVANDMIEVERHIATLVNSDGASQIAYLNAAIRELDELSVSSSAEIERRKSAVASAKEFGRVVKRVAGEVLDERLAAISPLLKELYKRLRPHSGWRDIEYGIRGDVQRFLSLKVGDDLNPQFIFSSGQRRVAGIAFLLSVHLSRPWSRLNTLLLDDPVQHIDDFRAVHLVELLAALSRDGHQIVFAVEDESLGELLTRRASRSMQNFGIRYSLERDRSGNANAIMSEIPLMARNVIRIAAES